MSDDKRESYINAMTEALQGYCESCISGFAYEDERALLDEAWQWARIQLESPVDHIDWLEKGIQEWQAAHAEAQARIDRLMLEFCPEDMTANQLANWARNQRISPARLYKALEPFKDANPDV